MSHQMTDDICYELSGSYSKEIAYAYPEFTVTVMRAAYDLGESKGRADMLDEVIEWLDEQGHSYVETESEGSFLVFEPTSKLLARLMKAMRPAKQEDNNG